MNYTNITGLKLIASDIDGVLTDGKIVLSADGNEQKCIYIRDLDAVGIGRSMGLDFVFITGEDNRLADTIARRFNVHRLIRGAKNKVQALQVVCNQSNIKPENVCYIGDSDRDAPAIDWAGFGVAPDDGSVAAKNAASLVTKCKGGRGVLAEVIELIYNVKNQVNL